MTGWQPRSMPAASAAVAAASTAFDEVRFCDGTLFWLESRPADKGRTVLVRCDSDGLVRDVTGPELDVGSSVYGYGGGVHTAGAGAVWFCESGGRLWRAAQDVAPAPVPVGVIGHLAGLHMTTGGRLLCVRERGGGGRAVTDIVGLEADGSGLQVLASGADFHAHPRVDPGGRRLAWLTWSDPLMPWDGTWLWTTDISRSDAPLLVAGGPGESVLQPEWGPDGHLYFLSDRSGWWNLYRHRDGLVGPVVTASVEMAVAPWELGYATYAFLPGGRIAVLLQEGPSSRLAVHDPATGALDDIDLPYTSIKPYLSAAGERLALIGSSPTRTATISVVDTTTGAVRELAGGSPSDGLGRLSIPEQITIPTGDGHTAHGLLYPPAEPDQDSPAERRPPLIVRPHPGPTTNVTFRLDSAVQFFTSRGFAVLDLDYRGSTGYGRSYRRALDGRWGVLDVSDCVDAADHLAATGRTHHDRVAISGASAGGYTALRALATTTRFRAGTARSAIADPAAWRAAVPRFQRHYTTGLIGPWPDAADRYRDRSVLQNADRITAPLLLIHGGRDPIAPLAQIEDLAARLRASGADCTMLVHLDERHFFRSDAAIAASLDAELTHYQHAGLISR